ncbi:hypothetical protein BDP55DRAFT_389349 [Colletotrichum godetiae]|uniref:Uncharacterized protein n=1 Tax=Colletotrichum godetiae TaxID=1209918 RepID=A0AAJ0EPL3_9PEZI|nr:uncharacterized protein BDP55DRAFT_389349 [Colletotrichum godetiae]KAK1658667.1 hypothetical protein BDP55DRAFT_389349 [Colletotrichum godetiae]
MTTPGIRISSDYGALGLLLTLLSYLPNNTSSEAAVFAENSESCQTGNSVHDTWVAPEYTLLLTGFLTGLLNIHLFRPAQVDVSQLLCYVDLGIYPLPPMVCLSRLSIRGWLTAPP